MQRTVMIAVAVILAVALTAVGVQALSGDPLGRGLVGSVAQLGAGLVGGGFGCCGPSRGSGASGGNQTTTLETLKASALDAFRADRPDAGEVRVEILNYGCHLQADIYEGDSLVASYAYAGGDEWVSLN